MAEKGGFLGALVVGVVVALVGGLTNPLWYPILFPSPPKHPGQMGMGALEVGINRNKGDFLPSREVADAANCSALCSANSDCLAMTYVAHPNVAGGVCWLKNVVTDAAPAAGMTSAVKVFAD